MVSYEDLPLPTPKANTVLVQLCKQWGYRSIATASTEAKLELARQLGADETINYITQDFEAEMKRLTNGSGVQLALDAVGGEVTEKSMRCLAPFGCLVNYAMPATHRLLSHYRACGKIAPPWDSLCPRTCPDGITSQPWLSF